MSDWDGDDPTPLVRLKFGLADLPELRHLTVTAAGDAGLGPGRAASLMAAVNEAASNAVRHGGGTGYLEIVADGTRAVIAHVTDDGPGLPDGFVVTRAAPEMDRGRGMWLMHASCDRVDVATGPTGTTVMLYMTVDDES